MGRSADNDGGSHRVTEVTSWALASAGVLVAGCVAVGAWAGVWADEKLGTSPWLAVTGVVLGVLAGFVQLWRLVGRMSDQ